MKELNFKEIDSKWQKQWRKDATFQATENPDKPKYYVLDMFPYPSGSGLHVGHPLGYIASDILARYKRNKGFEVLHPMGFDSFGLPAEQYAIETGQHPSVTTSKNIKRYKEQLQMLGLSFDWSREVRTSDPQYYRWTQWLFLEFFNSWYNKKTDMAEPVDELVMEFNQYGNKRVEAATSQQELFDAEEWANFNHDEKEKILLKYRLAYLADSEVNWCEELGTVLANDEVQNGYSVRGGHPVEKKKMRQWFLRISAYADRLLRDLDHIDWPDSLKEIQRNWIGKSVGAALSFKVEKTGDEIEVFTTRPDTLFGVSFMVLSPEHELVDKLVTPPNLDAINTYRETAKRKSERERMANAHNISGEFTGAYAIHPFTEEKIPIWIADYVLADYGTGAVMAVPAHDSRDHAFAQNFDLPIKPVVESEKEHDLEKSSYDDKDGKIINSDFLNGMKVQSAIIRCIEDLERKGIGRKEVNYKLRDAGFSRQRYWGEPFPVVFRNDIPIAVDVDELPVELPDVDSFKTAGGGESPLAREKDWLILDNGDVRETHTMPGNAGSSWYFLRYMDPHNQGEFLSSDREQYWQNVDFYVGGAEHATGHLLYARFWQKFLYDRAYVGKHEPFQKLINQGMIQGNSAFVYRLENSNKFVSAGLRKKYQTTKIHVDVSLVNANDELNIEAFRKWRPDFSDAEFELEEGRYYVSREVEKMSKSKYNVVNPDDLIEWYGCDTFRMYEMFLGPIEQSKPWNTDGIEGVFKFLKKFWGQFYSENGEFGLVNAKPTEDELKVLHKTIKAVTEDIERFSLNTCVSHFMKCMNELNDLKCRKQAIFEPLVVLLSPFAPHLCEELWEELGHDGSVCKANYPEFNEDYLKEDSFEYPVSVNGKMRTRHELPLDADKEKVEKEVLALDDLQKWLEGKEVKKFIYVPGKIINIAVK